jgi:hypothetical protein
VARRGPGISGLAVLAATTGIWLAYAGIRDVAPLGGLRAVLAGGRPVERDTDPDIARRGGPALVGVTAVGSAATGNLVTAGGIRVDSSIAEAVAQLVTLAATRGHRLTGSGWRSSLAQAQLRIRHCCRDPNSSQCGCGPPTAPVGQSRHETGQAVDFSWNGALIRTRQSAGFIFLAAEAPKRGLHNLPSEPWHWSIDGK